MRTNARPSAGISRTGAARSRPGPGPRWRGARLWPVLVALLATSVLSACGGSPEPSLGSAITVPALPGLTTGSTTGPTAGPTSETTAPTQPPGTGAPPSPGPTPRDPGLSTRGAVELPPPPPRPAGRAGTYNDDTADGIDDDDDDDDSRDEDEDRDDPDDDDRDGDD